MWVPSSPSRVLQLCPAGTGTARLQGPLEAMLLPQHHSCPLFLMPVLAADGVASAPDQEQACLVLALT